MPYQSSAIPINIVPTGIVPTGIVPTGIVPTGEYRRYQENM
jgi:hypothetical protein